MTAHRIPARLLMSEAQLAAVRTRSVWRGAAMVAHAWAVIIAAIAIAGLWPNLITILGAMIAIGSRQLGLAILMHEGAHALFTTNERLNLWISQWLCAYPVFAETRAYRRYHLKHHAHTQTDADPDLVLSAPFPITQASYRRKFWRDISGQTGYQQRKAQLLNAWGPSDLPFSQRVQMFGERLGRQVAVNAAIFAACAAAGIWWAYPVLWLAPLLTWMMVITRVRNIAEHAVVPDSTDPLRNTRTTHANLIERALVAPYFVNYHLEHHLLFYVPAYNLPKVHAILMQGPYRDRMEVEPGYLAVMRKALAKAAGEDKPGALVSNARRLGAGQTVSGDSASSGF